MSTNTAPPTDVFGAHGGLVTADVLTAVMRATWTWDDRALRRDLAEVLVAAEAGHLLSSGASALDAAAAWHRGHAVMLASQFVRSVLGNHLLTRDLEGVEALVDLALMPPTTTGDAAAVVTVFQSRGAFAPRTESSLGAAAGAAYTASIGDAGGTGRGLSDTALAAGTLRAVGGHPEAETLLKSIEAGTTATLAVAERLGTWDPALVRTRAATDEAGAIRLTGEKRVVPYVEGSDVLLVMGRTTAGPTLYSVDPTGAGVTIAATPATGNDAPFSTIKLAGVSATQIGPEGRAGRTMARLFDVAGAIVAAELVGHAERAIDSILRTSQEHLGVPHLVSSWTAAVALLHAAVDATSRGEDNGVTSAMAQIAAAGVARAATGHAIAREAAGADDLRRRERVTALDLIFGGPATAHERLLERMDI